MDVDIYLNQNPDIKIINQSSSLLLENEKPKEEVEAIKNRGNFLLRQELEDKTPINTPNCIIFYHIVFIIIFVSISISILLNNSKNTFIEIEYTSSLCQLNNSECEMFFEIKDNLKSPIYFYYKLDNFYSNHIDYVKSKNYNQLRGEEVPEKKIDTSCKYMSRNRDHFKTNNESEIISYKSMIMDNDSILDPCGLIANSIFNDYFELYDFNGKKINIIEKKIANEMDMIIFKNSIHSEYTQWLDKENEHFIVWMNMELFPNFIKKWGYINNDLPKGKYKMIISNKWGKDKWDIKKYFILAKVNKFGSETFFAYILIICSSTGILFIIIIYIGKFRKKKFNPEDMKWD